MSRLKGLEWRRLTENNFSSAFKLQVCCHPAPWSESVFKDSLTSPYFAYALCDSESVISYYIGLWVAGEATLMDIGVDDCHRSKGIGRAVLSHFLRECIKRDTDDVWLEVRASNDHAIALYIDNGFELIETRKDYYSTKTGREDGLIMRKRLAK